MAELGEGMKAKKALAWILGMVGAALAALTFFVCLWGLRAQPMLFAQPAGARERAVELMDAICLGDYPKAGNMLYGRPSLGEPGMAEGAEGMLWEAFRESLDYRIPGDCYASHDGITLDVEITGLDIGAVTEAMSIRSQQLLNLRIQQAEDIQELYDEKNEFRQDLIRSVLLQATEDALREDARVQTRTVPLHIVYAEHQWWVLPEAAFLQAISGETEE